LALGNNLQLSTHSINPDQTSPSVCITLSSLHPEVKYQPRIQNPLTLLRRISNGKMIAIKMAMVLPLLLFLVNGVALPQDDHSVQSIPNSDFSRPPSFNFTTMFHPELGDFPAQYLALVAGLSNLKTSFAEHGSPPTNASTTPPEKEHKNYRPSEKEVASNFGNVGGNLLGGFAGAFAMNAQDGLLKGACEGLAVGLGSAVGATTGGGFGWALSAAHKSSADNKSGAGRVDPDEKEEPNLGGAFGDSLAGGTAGTTTAVAASTALSRALCSNIWKDGINVIDKHIAEFLIKHAEQAFGPKAGNWMRDQTKNILQSKALSSGVSPVESARISESLVSSMESVAALGPEGLAQIEAEIAATTAGIADILETSEAAVPEGIATALKDAFTSMADLPEAAGLAVDAATQTGETAAQALGRALDTLGDVSRDVSEGIEEAICGPPSTQLAQRDAACLWQPAEKALNDAVKTLGKGLKNTGGAIVTGGLNAIGGILNGLGGHHKDHDRKTVTVTREITKTSTAHETHIVDRTRTAEPKTLTVTATKTERPSIPTATATVTRTTSGPTVIRTERFTTPTTQTITHDRNIYISKTETVTRTTNGPTVISTERFTISTTRTMTQDPDVCVRPATRTITNTVYPTGYIFDGSDEKYIKRSIAECEVCQVKKRGKHDSFEGLCSWCSIDADGHIDADGNSMRPLWDKVLWNSVLKCECRNGDKHHAKYSCEKCEVTRWGDSVL
jgi:hypothetical protein